MHIVCAVVGAGVLALPYSVSWLGWVAGPSLVLIFYLIALMSSHMLAAVYEVDGIEFSRYHHRRPVSPPALLRVKIGSFLACGDLGDI